MTVEPESLYNYTVRAVLSSDGCQTADSNCATVSTPVTPPPPVPDGSFGSPMTASRGDLSGSTIELTWDTSSCPAEGYHLLFGPLQDVASLGVAGAACNLSTAGSATFSDISEDDLWFLLVADDAATTEGSWGKRSDGSERAGSAPSDLCSMTLHHNTGLCF